MTSSVQPEERLPDRRSIDWRLGWIDRRRLELQAQLSDLDRQEREVLGLVEEDHETRPDSGRRDGWGKCKRGADDEGAK